MCKDELSAVIARLMSKCLWSRWKLQKGVKEISSPFPCYPVNRECSWKKTQIKKTCLVYINTSVASFFPSFIYDSFMHICFGFDQTKLTNGKLYRALWPVLKYYIKERDWIFRLRRQIWSCGICRLKFSTYWVILTMTKTGYNIWKSKSDLRLHNFREV